MAIPPVIKWRDVFAFNNVVAQSLAKLVGRALRVLLHDVYTTASSLALPMVGVRDLVCAVSRVQSLRSHVRPLEADVDDMFWKLDKEVCMSAISHALSVAKDSRREKNMVFALHKGGDKSLDRIGSSTSEEFRILTEEELLCFVRRDLFQNTLVVCGPVLLSQGKQGVPIGGHLAAHIAEFWAMYSEHLTFSVESSVRGERQVDWQKRVDDLHLGEPVTVVLPGAEPLVCFRSGSRHQLFGDVWASRDRFWADTDRVRSIGLTGWSAPADRLLAWVTVGYVDVPVLGVVPWDSAPGGRVHHIVQRTPRRDKARVLDFLSQFAPLEFVLGELGVRVPQQEAISPMVFLARFRDGVYIFVLNMSDALAAVVQPTVFQLLRAMYGVPLKWKVHGATVQWCESAIPDTRDLRLVRKGVVLDLQCFSGDEAEWSRWLPASAPNAGPVMQAQVPSILQKSLWFALRWRDVYANFRSFLWGLGVLGYAHRWWKPQVDRFCTQLPLRSRFPEAVVEGWYKEGRAKSREPCQDQSIA